MKQCFVLFQTSYNCVTQLMLLSLREAFSAQNQRDRDKLVKLSGLDQGSRLLRERKIKLFSKGDFESILQSASTIVTWLAEEHDICGGMALDIMRQFKSIQMRYCLEPCEFFSSTA